MVNADLAAGHKIRSADWAHYARYSVELCNSAASAVEKLSLMAQALGEFKREFFRGMKDWEQIVERARLAQQGEAEGAKAKIIFPSCIASELSAVGAQLAEHGMDFQRQFDILRNHCGANFVIRNID